MRNSILNRILSNAFDKEYKAIEAKRYDLSEKVYNDYYDKATRTKMEELPVGWLPRKDRMFVVFGNSQTGYCERNFKEPKLMLDRDTERRALKVYPYEHKLTIEHDKVTKELEAYKEKKQKARNEAAGVLNSVSTTGQLKEVWPSITSIIEEYEPSRTEGKTGTQVAPILADLNKILGLK